MNIWYLHGFRSSAKSPKVKAMQQAFPNCHVQGINYTPHSPVVAEEILINEYEKLIGKDDELIVVGTSLGGFWARWLASELPVNSLMINPSLDPDKTLETGEFKVFGEFDESIKVTTKDLQDFNHYRVTSEPYGQCEVALAMDDEVLDSEKTAKELEGIYPIHTFDTGTHRFTEFERVFPIIEKMIRK
ncbi:YqiA/YcfP family alpha/beta fold hydrolase [Kangiella sp. M94]